MRIPFFLIIFCLFVFSCKNVPTEKDLNIILSSKLSTVNLLISKGNITGVASPRTKSKNSFEIVNFNNEINVTYFTSPFYSDTVFKFNLSNEEIDSLFLILKEVVRTHNPNKKYEGCCMCSNTDIYITNGNISLDIKPSKETEYLIYNLVEKYRLILYENHINYRDSLIYRDSVDGNFLKQNVDEENLKDSTFVEQHLKAMFENDIISITEDSLFFVIPFDIHGFDCGAPDCYETVVSF